MYIQKTITNLISNQFHKLASHEFSKGVQSFINNGYVNLLGLDMSEFKEPSEYESLNALFTRGFETPREIDGDEKSVIAPCDSKVTQFGKLNRKVALQIKGMKYFIDDLLTNNCDWKRVVDGEYANFYLSPKDYHRYHAPLDLKIKKLIHIPGKLYPVNMRYLNNKINLFVENERVVAECETLSGKAVFLVFVGALNVGKMVFHEEKSIETNSDAREIKVYEYENLSVTKGEELGYFMMGSTVLMFAESGLLNFDLEIDQDVKYGQKIAAL